METLSNALGIDEGTLYSILWTLMALVVVLLLRRIARRVVADNVDLEEGAYRANKIINYLATGIFLATVAFIWVEAFDDLTTYLGLVSAGVAIALADVLKNMVGWPEECVSG